MKGSSTRSPGEGSAASRLTAAALTGIILDISAARGAPACSRHGLLHNRLPMGRDDAEQALADPERADALPGGVGHVYPLGSRINVAGRLEVGGCDVVELAREFGTPAYVYAEDDLRARARAFLSVRGAHRRLRGPLREQGLPVHRGVQAVRRGGALLRRRLGGELHLALRGGFDPERIYMHGNNKTEAELELRDRSRRRHDRGRLIRRVRAARADRPAAERDARVTPGWSRPRTATSRPARTTLSSASARRRPAGGRADRVETSSSGAACPHRLADLRPRAVRQGGRGARPRFGDCAAAQPRRGARASRTRPEDDPPSIEDFADALLRPARSEGRDGAPASQAARSSGTPA